MGIFWIHTHANDSLTYYDLYITDKCRVLATCNLLKNCQNFICNPPGDSRQNSKTKTET